MEIQGAAALSADDLGNWPPNTELECPCGHARRDHVSYAFECYCGCASYRGAIPTERDYLREGWVAPIGAPVAAQQSEQVPVPMSEEEAALFWGGGL